ncbi:MAG: hypothetical protein ABWZ75_05980 [Novosphingobium sp.]
MTFFADLLAPIVLLLPGAVETPPPLPVEASANRYSTPVVLRADAPDYETWRDLAQSFRNQAQNQVRIEQRITIRVIPRSSPQVNLLAAAPNGTSGGFVEKKMGKCVQISGIAGVQASGPSNLILFMRDQRMVSAALERSCRARDFYSGFYLERNSDGKLCVDRDTLLSRSGANCKLSRIRQLILKDE